MGDHYVPNYYLKGFAAQDGMIWVYGRDGNRFATKPANVAQENRFYSREVEKYLANEIEGPANDVLAKIRETQPLTLEDKECLANYIIVMMKRVPKGKQRVKKLMPEISEEVQKELDLEMKRISTQFPEKAQAVNRFHSEANQILKRYKQEFPDQVWLDSIPPEQTPQIADAITKMTWRFLTFKQPAILTSDNPVFYFEGIGIGRPEAELTFPLSSHIFLWATWRSDLEEGYFPTTMQAVKESNRRVTQNATKYIYHARQENWILPFLNKGKWQLNHLI